MIIIPFWRNRFGKRSSAYRCLCSKECQKFLFTLCFAGLSNVDNHFSNHNFSQVFKLALNKNSHILFQNILYSFLVIIKGELFVHLLPCQIPFTLLLRSIKGIRTMSYYFLPESYNTFLVSLFFKTI